MSKIVINDPYRLLTKAVPDLGFVYEENFLSAADCDELIACFNRNVALAPDATQTDEFFQNRFIWMPDIPLSDVHAKCIMQSARDRCAERIQKFFKDPKPLWADTVQLVKWPPGQGMPSHADNAEPDGRPHRTPYRKYASVVYLNGNYTGGELFIKPLKIKIMPKKGLMVGFKGDFSHEHGVIPVKEGMRYTMPMWFSIDPANQEREYAVDYCALWKEAGGGKEEKRSVVDKLLNTIGVRKKENK
jgi:hypothetical protein